MLAYTFTTVDDAASALARVNTHAGYPRVNNDVVSSGHPFTTETHCDILEHPDGERYGIMQDATTAAALPELVAVEMTADWYEL